MAPVISIRTEVTIKAPASVVWSKLIDTSTYPTWNTFVPQADTKPANADSPNPNFLALGSRSKFHAKLNGRTFPTFQRVSEFSEPETGKPGVYRISWVSEQYPSFLLTSYRFNEIEEVDGGCVYRTGEDQSGPMAYVVRGLFGRAVEKGIRDWAGDLKKVSEAEVESGNATQ